MNRIEDIVEYIKGDLPEDELFVPKVGVEYRRNPAEEKRRTVRGAYKMNANWVLDCIKRPRPFLYADTEFGITENKIFFIRRRSENRTKYMANKPSRPRWIRKLRQHNGKVEYMGYNGDCWRQPYFQGKGSRVYMRLVDEWMRDAHDALYGDTYDGTIVT